MDNSIISTLAYPGIFIALIVIVHASLQVSVSVLTLLSGHSFRKKQAHSRLLRLSLAYIAGVVATSLLILLGLQAVLQTGYNEDTSTLWSIVGFAMAVIGVVIMLNYYRRGKGTTLWLPRQQAEYLSSRARKTKNSFEAASLGAMTVIAELPISLVLYLAISLLAIRLPVDQGLWWSLAYAFAISLPLIIMTGLIGGGHRISEIQRWREQNKTFLKYSAGIGMVVAAIYVVSFFVSGGSV